ncbi:MAG: ABC transporter ATP-binding protein [Acidimicrobiales bacterium]
MTVAEPRASGGGRVSVRGLSVVYKVGGVEREAVSDADLDLVPGQITGLVGESGSGKSTLALGMMNAVQPPGRVSSGQVLLEGVGDILSLGRKDLRRVRGPLLGYVFQASQNSLNPLKKVGAQLLDLAKSHGVTEPRAVLSEARDLCSLMGMDAGRVLSSYQHELSGGMRQRVGIVFALVLSPRALVLDEPTTALDMLSQAAVLEIVRRIHSERQLATLIITHDIAVVADMADRLVVMYGGRVVEEGPTAEVLRSSAHPYTRALIRAIPRVSGATDAARALPGRPPELTAGVVPGCVFRDRCDVAVEVCGTLMPSLLGRVPAEVAPEQTEVIAHRWACHLRAPAEPVRVRDGADREGVVGDGTALR